jgi:DNA helicase HerA-like ATPase
MLKDGMIVLGKSDGAEVSMIPGMMNRHGLIAGASGTGKTVTLKVIAESLSEDGIPTFIADVKGDLTGMIKAGNQNAIQERLDSMGIKDFKTRSFPVRFFDVYRKNGLPMRAVLQEMDPVLLSQILGLSDAQEGVLQIIFKTAQDMDLDIIDLKDLQAMTQYVSEHASELSGKYGNVSKQSVGAIQRTLLELEQQGGTSLFGMPGLDINDLIQCEHQEGVLNILECAELFRHPMLYSTLLLWILDLLDTNLPEVGDSEKPKIVFFFDEAHMLFDNASPALMDKIKQIVKLIRSKGVGIFFCTQSPNDIPEEVLGQLSNKIQHALRAYTPAEAKAVKTAADSFRPNPKFKTDEVITNMKTGHALVSVLDKDGAPTIAEETKILPPMSSMSPADNASILQTVQNDPLYAKYMKDIDPASAYEKMDDIKQNEDALKAEEKQAALDHKLEEKKAAAEQKAQLKSEEKVSKETTRIAKKLQNKAENELINIGIRSAKSLLKGFLK